MLRADALAIEPGDMDGVPALVAIVGESDDGAFAHRCASRTVGKISDRYGCADLV
jgi:hypothetical protein